MVRIREINFNEYTLFQLFDSYWTDVYKSKNNRNWKYFWWKFEFRSQLSDAMKKKKRTNSLSDFDLFIEKLNDFSYVFDPTTNTDNELYFEKVIRIAEQLKKKKKRKKTNKLHKSKTFAFLMFLILFKSIFFKSLQLRRPFLKFM